MRDLDVKQRISTTKNRMIQWIKGSVWPPFLSAFYPVTEQTGRIHRKKFEIIVFT